MITIKPEDILENPFAYIHNKTKIISVAGGSGSGKTYFSEKLCEKIGARLIKLDDYIIPEKITPTSNWDLPECWNLMLVRNNLSEFLKGNKFEKPIYNFKKDLNNYREIISPDKPLVLEGLYSLYDTLQDLIGLSIFIDVNEKERLERVLKRDIIERGTKTPEKIIKRWNETIQPTYLELVEPQRDIADIVLN